MDRNSTLQALCRQYLGRLKPVADKYGLKKFVEDTIVANENGKCSADEQEVEFLSRCCDDERLERAEVPKVVGRSYRFLVRSRLFLKIKKLRRSGVYSKVSSILLGKELEDLYE